MRQIQSRDHDDAARWRKRAEMFRLRAQEADGEVAAQALRGLAEAWERWANRAERGVWPGVPEV